MAPFRFSRVTAALLAIAFLPATEAFATTAQDVLEKMTDKERFGYVTGLVEMLSYQSILSGNRVRGQCISDAFYGKPKEAWLSIMAMFDKYPDKAPEGLVIVHMNRACGSDK